MINRGRGGSVLLGALVVDSIGNGLFLPLSLVFFLRLTDVPLGLLGVLLSVASVLTLPIPVWAGSLADRFGALPLVVLAQVLQGVGYLGYVGVHGPLGVFAAAALVATGVRLFWSSVFTVIADYADGSGSTSTKDTWFAWASMARTAGLGVGGVLAGVAVADGRVGAYHAVAYGAAACFGVAAATIAVFVRAPRQAPAGDGGQPPASYRTMLRDRPFLTFTAINAVFAMTSFMLALGLPVFVLDGLRGPRALAPAVLVGNTVLLAVLTAPVVARLARFRRTRVVIAAGLLWAAWCALFALLVPGHPSWVVPVLLVAAALFTAAELIHAPVSMALATALAPPPARGRYLAVFQYSFTIASMVGPAFFTTLFAAHRALPWLALGGLNLAAVIATGRLERRISPR